MYIYIYIIMYIDEYTYIYIHIYISKQYCSIDTEYVWRYAAPKAVWPQGLWMRHWAAFFGSSVCGDGELLVIHMKLS